MLRFPKITFLILILNQLLLKILIWKNTQGHDTDSFYWFYPGDYIAKIVHFNGDIVYADCEADSTKIPKRKLLKYYRYLYQNLHDVNYVGQDFIDVYRRMPFINNWDDHEVIDDYAEKCARCGIATAPSSQPPAYKENVEDLKKQPTKHS